MKFLIEYYEKNRNKLPAKEILTSSKYDTAESRVLRYINNTDKMEQIKYDSAFKLDLLFTRSTHLRRFNPIYWFLYIHCKVKTYRMGSIRFTEIQNLQIPLDLMIMGLRKNRAEIPVRKNAACIRYGLHKEKIYYDIITDNDSLPAIVIFANAGCVKYTFSLISEDSEKEIEILDKNRYGFLCDVRKIVNNH